MPFRYCLEVNLSTRATLLITRGTPVAPKISVFLLHKKWQTMNSLIKPRAFRLDSETVCVSLLLLAFQKPHKGFKMRHRPFSVWKVFFIQYQHTYILRFIFICAFFKTTSFETYFLWGAFDSAKKHKRQRRKRQSVTAKREKSQTPKFV